MILKIKSYSFYSIIFSVAIHALLFCLLVFIDNPRNEKKEGPIEVSFSVVSPGNNSKNMSLQNMTGAVKSESLTKTDIKSISLSDLVPKFKVNSSEQVFSSSDSKVSTKFDKFSPEKGTLGVMNSIGASEYVELMPFLETIWNKINNTVDYPEDFKMQGIQGQVNIHLELNNKGQFIGDFLEITGSDGTEYLQIYVAATLLKNLQDPVDKKYWAKNRNLLPVMISFNFELYSVVESKRPPVEYYFKNALIFERREHVEAKFTRAISEFAKRYVPPIYPIPGGFMIDFVHAYHFIKNIGKPSESELRDERLKLFKSQLETTLKKRG